MMNLQDEFVEAILRYQAAILLMDDFYMSMNRNNQKDTVLDLVKLRQLLANAKFTD